MSNADKNTSGQSVSLQIKNDGLYAIIITAICNNSQDLRVEIDDKSFREIPPEKNIQKFNIPAAYNGAKLKGKTQTNIFILNLETGQHQLNFIAQNGAIITDWKLQKINDPAKIVFDPNLTAENYNRQPWVNFILVDLPLQSMAIDAAVDWHRKSLFRGDGDDIKLLINNKVITDNQTDWLFRAVKEQAKTGVKTLHKAVVTNFSTGTHYLELIADGLPTLHKITFNLSESENVTSYIGDFQCQVQTRKINNEMKDVIGIHKDGRDKKIFAPSNENYRLYFNGQEQPIGDDLKGTPSVVLVRFDLDSTLDGPIDDWYYFGVDTTFIGKHLSTWKKTELWSIHEK
jgi:hypothetical protein